MSDLKKIKLFLLDMDGTIYLDNELFDGTLDFLRHVKASEENIFSSQTIPQRALTNI